LPVVNRRSEVKVAQDVSLSLFAPLGCELQTGAGAILNTLNVQAGSTVAVFGVGSVGLSAIMASRIRQTKEIIAVDIQPSRLELAQELGATITINSKKVNVVEEIKKVCPPTGVRYALDCSGVPALIEQMIDSLGTRARTCSVGAPAPGKRAVVDVFSHLVMGREYVGCHQGQSIAQEVYFS
jgi:Zn-dependent alcohol dehydrogenase